MGTASITLRAAHPGDLDAVDRLLGESYPRLLKKDYPPSVMVTAVPVLSRANPSLLRSGTYYVAEAADGSILGAGGWTRSAQGGRAADIRHLVVDWRHQRKGIGLRLMMAVFAEAQSRGVERLNCQATRTAVPFYETIGFESLGAMVIPLRPGIDFPAVLMRRTL